MNAPRLPWHQIAPESYRAMLAVNASFEGSSLGKKLIDLVFLRVSQINGCAFCIDMHARDLLAQGEDLQRLNSLIAWRETGFFSERERAALHWVEQLARLADRHPTDADFEALRPHFSEREIVDLTVAAAQINMWNRIGVGMHLPVVAKPLAARAAA